MPDVQSESEDDEEEDVIIDIAGKEDSSKIIYLNNKLAYRQIEVALRGMQSELKSRYLFAHS